MAYFFQLAGSLLGVKGYGKQPKSVPVGELFVSMLEDDTQYDILQGNLYGYKGAIFENF